MGMRGKMVVESKRYASTDARDDRIGVLLGVNNGTVANSMH